MRRHQFTVPVSECLCKKKSFELNKLLCVAHTEVATAACLQAICLLPSRGCFSSTFHFDSFHGNRNDKNKVMLASVIIFFALSLQWQTAEAKN